MECRQPVRAGHRPWLAVMELLLPRTDAGVVVQLAVATVVFAIALFAVRRDPDVRLLVIGMAVMTAAWSGLRTLH